jgi:hypothetical protein
MSGAEADIRDKSGTGSLNTSLLSAFNSKANMEYCGKPVAARTSTMRF